MRRNHNRYLDDNQKYATNRNVSTKYDDPREVNQPIVIQTRLMSSNKRTKTIATVLLVILVLALMAVVIGILASK